MSKKLHKLLEDTPEAYYWMGFIMADGSFVGNRLKLGLSSKDNTHLKKLYKYLECENTIHEDNISCSFSIMDSHSVPLLKKKFDIKKKKTYNPPKTINWMVDYLKYAFIIGFIDGDGSIRKQHNREDVILRIKVHKNWFNIILEISTFISQGCNLEVVQPNNDKYGYVNINLANNILLKSLKNITIKYNLPVLNRKWSLINENYNNKNEIARFRVQQVTEMMKSGFTNKEIMEILNVKPSTLSNLKKRNGLR
jgi:hypothetical protein